MKKSKGLLITFLCLFLIGGGAIIGSYVMMKDNFVAEVKQLNIGSVKYENEEIYLESDIATDIILECSIKNVNVVRGDINSIRLKVPKKGVTVDKSNNESLKVSVNYKWYYGLLFNFFNVSDIQATITVAPDFNGNIYVKSSNGSLNYDIDNEIKLLKYNSSNGSIRINNLNAEELNSNLSNGNIFVENSNIKNVSAKTSNGMIQFNNVIAESVNADSSNDKILMYNLTAISANIESSNGKIEGHGISVKNGKFETSNSSIYIEFKEKHYYKCSTSNGKITYNDDTYGKDASINSELVDYFVEIESSNGNITVKD